MIRECKKSDFKKNGYTLVSEEEKNRLLSRINDNLKKVRMIMDELGIGYQNWDFTKVNERQY
jgi:hypothetical protein